MKLVQVFLLSFLFIACDDISLEDIEEKVNTAEIIQKLQGTYEECIPSVLFAGYYNHYTFTISGDTVTRIRRLDNNSNCASPYYVNEDQWTIKWAEYADSSKTVFNIELSTVHRLQNFLHSWYVGQNYCGYTDWAVGVAKNLTGVDCPGLIVNPHSTSFRQSGESEFQRFTLTPTHLSAPVGYTESGDTLNEIKYTETATVIKL